MKTTIARVHKGFTLIELLVVISIISLLSSIVYANLATARAKSIDVKKKTDLSAARQALISYNLDTQAMPRNYDCSGSSCVVNDSRTTLAIEDVAHPDAPQTEAGKAYRASMLELVAGKYIASVPHSPGGAGYVYYNYGAGSSAGAIFGTTLDTGTPSSTGEGGSCRPFEVSNSPTAPGNGGAASAVLATSFGGMSGHCTVAEDGLTKEYPICSAQCAGAPGRESCNFGGQACPLDAQLCPDGTALFRSGPGCKFPSCPAVVGNEGSGGSTNNLCSATNSRDYCMCVKY